MAVGKVVEIDAHVSMPDKHISVFVAHTEECASDILVPGTVVIWPTDLLAIYRPPTIDATYTDTSQNEVPKPQTSIISDIPSKEDRFLNYGLQVIQLGMMLMQLNDTEGEGDGARSLINWKMLMLYYRCRPRGMKYAYEAMRFITCVKGLYTEKMAHRVLHGQFVNPKEAEGTNYPNDLKMEHLVGNNKVSMRGMCGNKTLKAVQRCSGAAYGIKECCIQFDNESGVPPESNKHTHTCTTEDINAMLTIVQQAKPFDYHPGRVLHSFPHMSKSPLDKLDVALLSTWLTNHKRKLFAGNYDYEAADAEAESDEEQAVSGEDDDLDM